MLDAVTDLARLEVRLFPERAAVWLTLVADHPAATQETKDRVHQLLLDVEGPLGADQIQMIRERVSDQSLASIVEMLSSR